MSLPHGDAHLRAAAVGLARRPVGQACAGSCELSADLSLDRFRRRLLRIELRLAVRGDGSDELLLERVAAAGRSDDLQRAQGAHRRLRRDSGLGLDRLHAGGGRRRLLPRLGGRRGAAVARARREGRHRTLCPRRPRDRPVAARAPTRARCGGYCVRPEVLALFAACFLMAAAHGAVLHVLLDPSRGPRLQQGARSGGCGRSA